MNPHPHPDQGAQTAGLPSNLDAEMALLGALLYDNAAFERISDSLNPGHFFEPFHGRVFAAVVDLIRKGQLAEPVVIMERFRGDPAFEELGGLRYLADLVDDAPPSFNAPDYARVIESLALRRNLIGVAEFVRDGALRDFGTEPKEMLEAAESALFALAETGQRDGGLEEFSGAVDRALDGFNQAFQNDGAIVGLATGLIDLDAKLGGLHKTDLLILAGRPSQGKTALATNIAYSVAKRGEWVAFFSLEMSREQLAGRIIADVANVPSDRLRNGKADATEMGRAVDAGARIRSMPLHIDDTGALHIGKLVARARRMKRRHGLSLVVVDYLQLVVAEGEGRAQQVSAVTQALKALAKELEVPVLALSQLSRKVEDRDDKRPQLSDLRESGAIEQDADAVMFVFREEYYLGRAEPKAGTPKHLDWLSEMDACRGLAEVIIGKQRHGPIGTVRLHFSEDHVRFSDRAPADRYQDRESARGPAPASPRYAEVRMPYPEAP